MNSPTMDAQPMSMRMSVDEEYRQNANQTLEPRAEGLNMGAP